MKNEKQTIGLPPVIEAEIDGLVSKLETKLTAIRRNIFFRALKAFNEKLNPKNYHLVSSQQHDSELRWTKRMFYWQLALSFVGWLSAGTITKQFWSDSGVFQSLCWLIITLFLPGIASHFLKKRGAYWLASFGTLSGLPLLFLSWVKFPWYGLALALAPPTGHTVIQIMKMIWQMKNEETRVAAKQVTERQLDPVRSLRNLIAEHRQKIVGRDSEFGSHLAKLETRYSQIFLNQDYWKNRHQRFPDSTLYATRYDASQSLLKRIWKDIEVLRGKKQEIMAGLDQLELRLPQIDSELEDWRHDRELQILTDEEAQLSRETEAIATRTVCAFASEMKKIAIGIEGLRLNIVGAACDPRLIELTVERTGEIIDNTDETVAISKAALRA